MEKYKIIYSYLNVGNIKIIKATSEDEALKIFKETTDITNIDNTVNIIKIF